MRTLAGIALILAVLAATLGVSLSSSLRDQERVMDEFVAHTRQQVHASREALSARLVALDEDTRLLADLLERSRPTTPAELDADKRVWQAVFHALAVVVPQYRTISFVDASGSVQVLATDPTESKETIDALLPPTLALASQVAADKRRAIGAPARFRDRSFLLYGTPVLGGSIIIVSDAKIFLGAVAWTPLPVARLFVTDPAGVVWAGCETQKGCEAEPSDRIPSTLPRSSTSPLFVARGTRGDPRTTPAVQVSERLDRPTGNWTVTWLASTEALEQNERSIVARILLTALAAAGAVAAVGAAMFRQHRKAMQLESRLQVAQALVRAEKLITVGVLSAGIAHEIGSPLAVIRGRAERTLDHEPAYADDMRIIIKHIDSISTKIRQLLDFSRRQVVAPSRVSLAVAVERARELVQWKLAAKRLAIVVRLPEVLPALAADSEQLQQVLVNLLLNACDASTSGQSVLVTAEALADGAVAFSVVDQGHGIPPENLHTIFDPFFTTKKRGEGTGLGLTIVEGVVRNHGGEIQVTSQPGAGTTVTVRWPTEIPAVAAERARAAIG
ncbi:MAG TPA: ATP-binding protein [Polyangia bacterium]|nr:ATP-binding protein [Polyangia bacterium]